MVAAALVAAPWVAQAADDKDVDVKVSDKVSEANRKAHEKLCQGNHGTVTAKTDNSITIDGKQFAMKADTQVNKQEEAILLKGVKVGDTICYATEKAADGSDQISKLMAVDKNADKIRVRDKDSDTPGKVEVETPNKKIEVK